MFGPADQFDAAERRCDGWQGGPEAVAWDAVALGLNELEGHCVGVGGLIWSASVETTTVMDGRAGLAYVNRRTARANARSDGTATVMAICTMTAGNSRLGVRCGMGAWCCVAWTDCGPRHPYGPAWLTLFALARR